MGDPYFNNMLMEHQMKMANNLDFWCIVGLRNDMDYKILKEVKDAVVYIIAITSSTIPADWKEVIERAKNKQLFFHKVGISNTNSDPTYHDYKSGPDGPATEKTSVFARMQRYAHPSNESDYLLLNEHLGMGDTAIAIINCVKEFTEKNRARLVHKYEQDVLGMIVDNFGYHPAGNLREGSKNPYIQEDSFSNMKRIAVLEEKKNGVGTLEQFFI